MRVPPLASSFSTCSGSSELFNLMNLILQSRHRPIIYWHPVGLNPLACCTQQQQQKQKHKHKQQQQQMKSSESTSGQRGESQAGRFALMFKLQQVQPNSSCTSLIKALRELKFTLVKWQQSQRLPPCHARLKCAGL